MEQQPVPEKWSARPAASSNWSVVVAVLLVGSAILGLAYLAERRHAADLAAENKKMAATLSQTQDCLFASDDIPGNGAQAPSSKKP